ncbi:MAG: ribonuclease H-like domain-containing protein [Patescibacteria group bacterium]
MGKNDIVFDIETKKSFQEVGGAINMEKLGISVLGAYFYADEKYQAFEEHELFEFEKIIRELAHKKHGKIIGFNIHHFDLPVLQPYISWNLKELPSLDLMNDVENGAGFRISLDNLAQNTLQTKKSGDGMQAITWFKEGKIEEIKKYCLKDVEITKNLYEYGAKEGRVYFFARNAMNKVPVSVNWKAQLYAEKRNNEQLSIF